jgi:phosphoglycerate dehydrogenase-like enzyme
MVDDLGDDEAQELLREHRVESRLDSERSQPRHLLLLAHRVGSRQTNLRLVAADLLGDLEPLGEQVHEGSVDVVDARPVARQLGVWLSAVGRGAVVGHGSRDATVRHVTGSAADPHQLPRLFVDHPFPDAYHHLVAGRAIVVGSGTDDGLDTADAILAGAVRPWNAAAFALAPNAKVISRVGVGYDNVDIADATAAGVVVCNTPIAPMVSTAEHTLALIFAVTKHLPHHVERARQGLKGEPVGRALELDSSVLGLVGIGRIASRVAVVANALGMTVIASDPAVLEPPVPGVEMVPFDQLLATADVVSVHAPALPSTYRMFDAGAFERMKPGAYFVNCARGVLVDHDALLAAIDSGQLGGAGLDVTDPEPLPAGHPLLDRPNVVVTPHIASASVAGRRRLYEHSIDNALAVLEGKPASRVVG